MRFAGLTSPRRRVRTPLRPQSRRARPSTERLEGRALLTISIEPRPQFVAYVGETERLVAATFTESDPSLTAADFTATIDWGDGTASVGDVTRNADGSFDVSAPKDYAQPGTYWFDDAYPVTVTIVSPVNGDAASTAEVDSGPFPAQGTDPAASRGIVGDDQAHYIADYDGGAIVVSDSFSAEPSLIPVPGPGGIGAGHPTGVALLPGSPGTLVIPGSPGTLVIVTADGTIAVWEESTPATATTLVDNSASGADYEGVTVGTIPTAGGGTESVIYVANFASGQVETYDAQTFAPVDLGSGAFTDPNIPAGYAPFNVQDINGTIYVAYAEQSGAKDQPVTGAGLGFVDSFDATGHLLARFSTPGGFNAPSGIALAPSDMGVYAGDLLVANTGDGTISVLDPNNPSALSGSLPGVLGRVAGPGGGALTVPGLWGLTATTYSEFDDTYTYLYDSADGTIGSVIDNPSIAVPTTPPTTGIQSDSYGIDDYLGNPSQVVSLGEFVDATGAVDGSDAGTLSVTIDWGDGSAPTAGTLTFYSGQNLPSGADYDIDGTAPYTSPGSYTATVTVTMAGGATYTAQVPVTVFDGPEPIAVTFPIISTPIAPVSAITASSGVTATASAPVDVTLGTVNAPSGTYKLAIDWGDGSTPTFGTVGPDIVLIHDGVSLSTTSHDLTGSHDYTSPGTYTIKMNLIGPGGVSEWASTQAVVAPSLLSVNGNFNTSVVTQGQPLQFSPATFLYDPTNTPLPATSFVAAIDWRDGSAPTFAQVELTVPDGSGYPYYTIEATHTYRTPGYYTPFVNVIAPDGESKWAVGQVDVTPDPEGPSDITTTGTLAATEGVANLNYVLATFVAPIGGNTAAVDWGDGSAPSFADVVSMGPVGGGLTEYAVEGSHDFATAGDLTAKINILAPNWDSDWVARSFEVTAPGPATDVTTAPVTGYAGIALTAFPATFDGASDFINPGYTAAIDWGDGTSTFATVKTSIVADPLPGVPGASSVPDYYITGTHTYDAPGTYTLKIDIVAPDGSSSWASTTATIAQAPTAPVGLISYPAGGYADVPSDLELADFLADPRQVYTAAIDWGDGSAPSFAQVLPRTARDTNDLPDFGIVGTHTYAAPGTYTAKIDLLGPDGSSEWTPSTITIGADPSAPSDITATGTLAATQGLATPYDLLATFDAPAGSFKAAVDWGDGSDTFATVRAIGTVGGLTQYGVYGSHTYAGTGDDRVLINILAPDGVSDWGVTQVDVHPPGGAPTDLTTYAQSGVQGATLYGYVATFRGDLSAAAGYTAAIDWGDGTSTFAVVVPSPLIDPLLVGEPSGPGPDYNVRASHAYAAPGTYTLKIDIVAPDGSSTWTSTTATILPAGTPADVSPKPVVAIQDAAVPNPTLATFEGDPALTYAAYIDWGDGSDATVGVVSPLAYPVAQPAGAPFTIQYAVQGSHTYYADGRYTLVIEIVASNGQAARTSTLATVDPANLSLTGYPDLILGAVQGQPMPSVGLASFDYLTGTTHPAPTDFTAAVDWGDGTSTFTTVEFDPGDPDPTAPPQVAGTVRGSHTYSTPGDYTLRIHLFAPDGEGLWASTRVYVSPDPTGPSEVTPFPVAGTQDVPLPGNVLAAFLVPGTGFNAGASYVAAVDWGDGSSPSFARVMPAPVPQIVSIPPYSPFPNVMIVGAHTYIASGTFTIKINVIRSDGESDWFATTATIAPVADPVSDLSALPVVGPPGEELTDALLAQLNVPNAPGYRAAIDWGDGTAPSFGTVGPIQSLADHILLGQPEIGAFGTHTYAAPGEYAIRVNLLGPDGESLWIGTTATIIPPPVLPPATLPDLGTSPVASFGTPAWYAALAQARQITDRSRLA